MQIEGDCLICEGTVGWWRAEELHLGTKVIATVFAEAALPATNPRF